MPKLVVSATGDEFFLPDDSHYYLSQIKGPIYLDMLPNTEHYCFGKFTHITQEITAFYLSVLKVGPFILVCICLLTITCVCIVEVAKI